MTKLLHIGLCAGLDKKSSFPVALDRQFEYSEVPLNQNNLDRGCISVFDMVKPDLVFMQLQAPGIIQPDTVKYFKEKGAVVFNWTGDVREPIPAWYYELGEHCVTLFSSKTDPKQMQADGFYSEYLQIGYDPDIYSPYHQKVVQLRRDIVFMGNTYKDMFPLSEYRKELVNALSAKFKGRFGVYGVGWKLPNGNLCGDQRREAAAYRSVPIALNCSHFEYDSYTSDRMFRIMGCGVMCLTHRFPGMEDMGFIDGENCVVFESVEDCVQKAEYYIQEKGEASRIATKGWGVVSSRYTFDAMTQNIIELYDKYK